MNQPLPFVGSESVNAKPVEAAARVRAVIGFDVESRRACSRWEDALRMLITQVDAAGIMVMVSGVVGNNNTRTLNPQEFRGFALADGFAPLVFLNGIDTKSAQMFTLAHEVAHIFLGETALSDSAPDLVPSDRVERWCNEVAAELLIPMDYLQGEYRDSHALADEMNRLARVFKVSTLVVLRRLLDARKITRSQFNAAYEAELERLLDLPERGGGNFYLTQGARLSKRFARAIIMDTLAGQTLFRDAQRMLGITKMETFQELGRSLNLPI
jgi:Zn-dependent peptidase ImmA (M78 family)